MKIPIHTQSMENKGRENDWFSYTSTRQTTRTWPEQITKREDLPADFAGCGVFDQGAFDHAVYVPEDITFLEGRASKTVPKAVLLQGTRLTVLEKTRKGIANTTHELADIHRLRMSKVLLSAEFLVASSHGVSRVAFNAVRDDLFYPLQTAVRRSWVRRPEPAEGWDVREVQTARLATLPLITYKFITYGASAIMSGQPAGRMVFQESINIKKTRRGLFRWIDHFSAPFLVMRTEDELIIIEEPRRVRHRKRKEYGGLFTYLPLTRVKRLSLEGGEPARLRIELPGDEAFVLFFTDAQQARALL